MSRWVRDILKEITDLSMRLSVDPGDFWCLMRRARCRRRLGEADQAIDDFSLALKSAPKHPLSFRAFIERGLTYFGEGMHREALADFTEAISIVPVFRNVYCYRAETHRELEEYEPEILDYSSALALSPGDTHILFYRAEAFATIAQYEKAIQDFTQVIRLESDRAEKYYSAQAYYGRGSAFYAQGDGSRAVADYTEAIRVKPEIDTYLVARALAFVQLGDYRQAAADYLSSEGQKP